MDSVQDHFKTLSRRESALTDEQFKELMEAINAAAVARLSLEMWHKADHTGLPDERTIEEARILLEKVRNIPE